MNKTQTAIDNLTAQGYIVTKPIRTVKKTFVVDEQLLFDFLLICHHKNLVIKDALSEALKTWIRNSGL